MVSVFQFDSVDRRDRRGLLRHPHPHHGLLLLLLLLRALQEEEPIVKLVIFYGRFHIVLKSNHIKV